MYEHEIFVLRKRLSTLLVIIISIVAVWQGTVLTSARNEVEAERAKWDLAAQGSQNGMWVWSPSPPVINMSSQPDGEMWFGPRFLQMLGLDGESLPRKVSTFLNLLHPDDVEVMDCAIVNAVESEASLDTEFRLKHADGTYHWYIARAAVDANSSGEVVSMSGSIMPNDQSSLERMLLLSLFDTAPMALVVCDEERNVIIFNTEAEKLTGYARKDVIGKKAEDVLLDPVDHDAHVMAYTKASKMLAMEAKTDKAVSKRIEGKLQKADGQLLDVDVSLHSVKYDGERLAFVAYINKR